MVSVLVAVAVLVALSATVAGGGDRGSSSSSSSNNFTVQGLDSNCDNIMIKLLRW